MTSSVIVPEMAILIGDFPLPTAFRLLPFFYLFLTALRQLISEIPEISYFSIIGEGAPIFKHLAGVQK